MLSSSRIGAPTQFAVLDPEAIQNLESEELYRGSPADNPLEGIPDEFLLN
jgi:hypothetical protein